MSEETPTRTFLSIEILIAALFPLLIGIFGYGQLYGDVADNSERIKILTGKAHTTEVSVNEIKTDVAVIKTDLKNISKSIDKTAEQAEENSKALQEILRRVRNGDIE